MPRSAPAAIRLTPEEEAVLRSWTRKATGEHRRAERAHIIFLSHEGESVEKIAARLRTRPARVSKWRQRFIKLRLNALSDASVPASRRNTVPILRSGFWPCWIKSHLVATPSGTVV